CVLCVLLRLKIKSFQCSFAAKSLYFFVFFRFFRLKNLCALCALLWLKIQSFQCSFAAKIFIFSRLFSANPYSGLIFRLKNLYVLCVLLWQKSFVFFFAAKIFFGEHVPRCQLTFMSLTEVDVIERLHILVSAPGARTRPPSSISAAVRITYSPAGTAEAEAGTRS
ncbi:MAG: hypothetical protein FWG03_07900, partial [Clostridiales bacterium]|nr:hypothetical protein [Clostridiales bacterium]